MLATLVAAMVMAPQSEYLTCAVNNNDSAGTLSSEYAGIKVMFCCAGCVPKFTENPTKYMKQSAENKVTVAESFFDPITGKKILPKRARAKTDYKGVRYYFANADHLKTFEANKAKYTKTPKYEALHCPVMNEPVARYSKADSYVDYKDTRYYMCCAGCLEPMQKDPAKFAAKAKSTTPKVILTKSK